MLLNRKTKFSISETQIKEEVDAPDGTLLLKINIKHPNIKCAKKDPLSKYAVKFYIDVSSAFLEFAKKDLAKTALSAYNADKENFLPYSAVMRYEVTLENADYLSVMLDIAVFDGKNTSSFERKTQVWERKYGTKCKYTNFVPKKQLATHISETEKKRFDRDLFVLREGVLEFFIRNGDGYSKILMKLEESDKK